MKITIEIDTESEKDSKVKRDYYDFAVAMLKAKRPRMISELTPEERILLDQDAVDQFSARKAVANSVADTVAHISQ